MTGDELHEPWEGLIPQDLWVGGLLAAFVVAFMLTVRYRRSKAVREAPARSLRVSLCSLRLRHDGLEEIGFHLVLERDLATLLDPRSVRRVLAALAAADPSLPVLANELVDVRRPLLQSLRDQIAIHLGGFVLGRDLGADAVSDRYLLFLTREERGHDRFGLHAILVRKSVLLGPSLSGPVLLHEPQQGALLPEVRAMVPWFERQPDHFVSLELCWPVSGPRAGSPRDRPALERQRCSSSPRTNSPA